MARPPGRRRTYRSRATVIAETPGAGLLERHRAGRQRRRRSSRRRRRAGPSVRRRRAAAPHGRRPRDPERPADVGRALVATELELGDRSRAPARARARHGSPSVGRGDVGDQRRLVVAALPLALGVDRDRHDHAWRPRRPGASVGPRPRRAGERAAARPTYFSSWRAARTGPANGAHHSSWRSGNGQVGGQADRACRPAAPGVRRAPAGTSRRAARPRGRSRRRWPGAPGRAPRGGRGHGRGHHRGKPAKDCHRDMVKTVASPPDVSAPDRTRRTPRRPTLAAARDPTPARRPPARPRSPTAVPVRSIVPTGSSRTPCAPRTSGTSPVHARSPRWTDRPLRAAAAGVGPAQEDGVDREAHEHHVDPVRARQPEARRPAASAAAHQAHEPAPQAVGRSPGARRGLRAAPTDGCGAGATLPPSRP